MGKYRGGNTATISDRNPILFGQTFSPSLGGQTMFFKFDLLSAVITPFGLFEFERMLSGLRKASQTFQQFMMVFFGGLVLHSLT